MYGKPEDVPGECNAHLYIADDYGDNSGTMRCQLASGHEGLHREEFDRNGHPVVITWVVDERERCDHGCGQWRHAHEDCDDEETGIKCPKNALDHSVETCAFCNPGLEPRPCSACGAPIFLSRHFSCVAVAQAEPPQVKATNFLAQSEASMKMGYVGHTEEIVDLSDNSPGEDQ